MSAILILFVLLIIGLKKNEKDFLSTQAKFAAKETERLVDRSDLIVRLNC